MNRRNALKLGAAAGVAMLAAPVRLFAQDDAGSHQTGEGEPWLTMSVQQYSFHHQLQAGELKVEDFPKKAVDGTGIKALEYYNGHMMEKGADEDFFKDLRKRCNDLGATNTLMLCRSEHAIDSPEANVRDQAVEGYRPWMTATKILGGKFIRVDTRHKGDFEEQKKYAVEGLKAVCKVASEYDLGILVENHGGHSSNGAWLAEVMAQVDLDNCGTLPDFQNFTDYDPYRGVAEMMPFAKVLCAKSKSFDKDGNETNVDFMRMLKIAKDANFNGYIGIEFEGHDGDPIEGIKLTQRLIKKVMTELG